MKWFVVCSRGQGGVILVGGPLSVVRGPWQRTQTSYEFGWRGCGAFIQRRWRTG